MFAQAAAAEGWHELVTRADRQARVTLSVVGHVGPAELGHGLKDFRPARSPRFGAPPRRGRRLAWLCV